MRGCHGGNHGHFLGRVDCGGDMAKCVPLLTPEVDLLLDLRVLLLHGPALVAQPPHEGVLALQRQQLLRDGHHARVQLAVHDLRRLQVRECKRR